MAKKKDAEHGQQMRIQQDGSIIPETPELLTSEEDDAVRKEKLAKASDEVLELMKRNSDKGWIELFLIVDKVEEEQLYLPEYKSITAWGQALADRGGFRLRELWRRKRAGSAYREYEKLKEARGKTVHHLEELAETTGMTPRNIETITKIAGGNKRIKEKLLDQLSTEKIGQDQLDAMWDAAKAAGIQPKKSRHQKDVEDEELLERAITAGRIVAAIQGANDGKWLPEEHKKRPWIKDKYQTYTEVPVYNGTTNHPERIDVALIETYGCELMTDAIIHAIEIKVSKSDLERDVKMGDYADFSDYMWLAVPAELRADAEKHIDDLQGNQTWGLLLLDTDPETEMDRLVVARKPKKVYGLMRGKVFEYLVAKYI